MRFYNVRHHYLIQDIKQHYHDEKVQAMVNTGVSPCRIKSYLHRWVTWWVSTAQSWQYEELLAWFLNMYWDLKPAAYAAGLLHHAIMKTPSDHSVRPRSGFHATA